MNLCLPRSADENQNMAKKILEGVDGITVENAHNASYCAFFLDKEGAPVGGVLFYGYSEHNVFITLKVYNPAKVTRDKIDQGFALAFEAPLNVYRITALVPATNRRSHALVKRLGFHKEGECIGFDGSEDDVTYIYRYTQKDWYGSKFYGRKPQS